MSTVKKLKFIRQSLRRLGSLTWCEVLERDSGCRGDRGTRTSFPRVGSIPLNYGCDSVGEKL